jgi:hypothetical protein
MDKIYTIRLAEHDLGQAIEGLEMRAEAWEKTADYLRTEKMPKDEFFIVEECSNPDEADSIAAHYRSILEKIRSQMESQK